MAFSVAFGLEAPRNESHKNDDWVENKKNVAALSLILSLCKNCIIPGFYSISDPVKRSAAVGCNLEVMMKLVSDWSL